jgi:hypothetical protein
VTHFNLTESRRLSRRQAAERLVDLAYTLTAGHPLEVRADGETMRVAVPEDGLVELDLELSWSSRAGD